MQVLIARLSKLREKPRAYWVRLVVFLVLGTLAASWAGNWDVWIDARFKIYQLLQTTLPGKGRYVKDTFLILIHDDDYWKGELKQRVPIRRDYLAKVVRALKDDYVGIIVLDFDLRAALPEGTAAQDSYRSETEDLAAAVKEASENVRAVILPKTIAFDAEKNYVADADVIDGFSFNDHVHRGYIALPYDIRRLPLTLTLKDNSKLDSLSEATARAWDEQSVGNAPQAAEEAPFAGFLSRDRFDSRVIDAGEFLSDPKRFKDKLQSKIVIVGADWHEWAYGRGPFVDSYYTPAGEMPGSMIHANYVEALLAGRTYRPVAEWLSKCIEVMLVLVMVMVFALEFRPLYKTLSVAALLLVCLFTSYVAFINFGIFFDFLIPILAVVLHAGLEQVLDWRDLAQKWEKHEASLAAAAGKALVPALVGLVLLGASGWQNLQAMTVVDGQNPVQQTGEKPKPPIDPGKPGGARETGENSSIQVAMAEDVPPTHEIARLLSDNQPHVFIAVGDLKVFTASGQICMLGAGDVLEVTSAPPAGLDFATATVLASKEKECPKSTQVEVTFDDLLQMQNHMRQTIDQGLRELQTSQEQNATAGTETLASYERVPPPPAVTVDLGQTTAQVTALLGQPKIKFNLGARKIYVYPDFKLTFKDDKLIDVQ